jgi:hypothetical protein
MTVIIDGTAGVTFPAGGVGNTASAVVGLTDTQTLTNKTLTSPTISGAVVSSMASSVITSGTSVATTSGTSIDFTSIPSWVKRITLIFQGVSTNGTSDVLIQLGSGSISTSGYVSTGVISGATTGPASSTSGYLVYSDQAAFVRSGLFIFSLLGSNNWAGSHVITASTTYASYGGGSNTLSGVLDRVRLTTRNGTDTFDAGSINILYE